MRQSAPGRILEAGRKTCAPPMGVAQCNPNGLCLDSTHVVVSRQIRRQAAFDLKCSEQITVTRLGRDTFGASGCDGQASYLLVDCLGTECRLIQNTQTQ